MWPIVFLLLAVLFIVVSTTRLSLHPFLALLLAALGYGMACTALPGSTLTVAKVVDAIPTAGPWWRLRSAPARSP